MSNVLWKHKPSVVIGNLVTSSLFVLFTHAWVLSHRERMKTKAAVCVNVIYTSLL